MKELLLATGNLHKAQELQALLAGTPYQLRTLKDFPHLELPPETGTTFQQNAAIKAEAAAAATGLLTLADDSGIEVDALDGAPGVYSARYAGEEKSDQANNQKLLKALAALPAAQRGAQFHCVVALAQPGKPTRFCEGICRGQILDAPQGEGGFGYDPLFFLPQFGRSMAQLTPEEKNAVSHGGEALRKAILLLQEMA